MCQELDIYGLQLHSCWGTSARWLDALYIQLTINQTVQLELRGVSHEKIQLLHA